MTVQTAERTITLVQAIWPKLRKEAEKQCEVNPWLAKDLARKILSKKTLRESLSCVLALPLDHVTGSSESMENWFYSILGLNDEKIIRSAMIDLDRLYTTNPACPDLISAFLSFRGFHALQLYRIAHSLWSEGDKTSAVLVQNWTAVAYGVDIHPAASIGDGLFLDHALGIVIGETAIVEDGVSIWHNVTLGSTFKDSGARHPVIRKNAMLCTGATVLGRVEVGENAVVAAGALVTKDVAPNRLALGSPARDVGPVPQYFGALTNPNCTNK